MTTLRRKHGVTVIELLVVLAIITTLLSFLTPALMRSRDAALRTICQNNLHQLGIAYRQYVDVAKKRPEPPPENSAGGWSVVLLGFLEQLNLQNEIEKDPVINPAAIPKCMSHRPRVMTCPAGSRDSSTIPGIPVANYVYVGWYISDAPLGFSEPWVVGPTAKVVDLAARNGPHNGGYHVVGLHDGVVEFKSWQTE